MRWNNGGVMMKKVVLIFWVVFTVLTFVGAGYVIFNGGRVNAGYACVPMALTFIPMGIYRNLVSKEEKKKATKNQQSE